MPTHLKIENLPAPGLIDIECPEISWLFGGNGNIQRKCRVIVSQQETPVWDSGYRMTSHTRMEIEQPLQPRTEYTATVTTVDENGEEETSALTFETGLLRYGNENISRLWQAKWIGGGKLFRKTFYAERIEKARAYVTGLGFFEMYLNGKKIGDDVLSPSYTSYHRRMEYMAYDITDDLAEGENTLCIHLGEHWPLTEENRERFRRWSRYYAGLPCGLLQLDLFNEDGSFQTLVSDESFKVAPSPVTLNGIYYGEDYDARLEIPGWYQNGFDDSAYPNAAVMLCPTQKLSRSMIPPIKVIERMPVAGINPKDEGRYILDFGQNITGWIAIRVSSERGREIIIRTSELLDDDGELNRENLRSARSEDHYICKGDGEENYCPRFTYHGFRYAEILNWPGELKPGQVTAHVTHSSMPVNGSFSCSDELLNRIHQAMVWTLRTNLQSIPTDCCQRDERQGWMGDAQTASYGTVCNFDMCNFYRKWLDDITDVQDEQGDIRTTCTPYTYPELPHNNESFTWKAAYYIILSNLYREYRDLRSVRIHYPRLKKYAAFLRQKERKNVDPNSPIFSNRELCTGILMENDYADCLGVETIPVRFIRDAYYVDFQKNMADFAAVLGLEEDRRFFESRYMELCEEYHQVHYYGAWYYQDKTKDLGTGYYGACRDLGVSPTVLSLTFGIAPESYIPLLMKRMLFQIIRSRGSVQCPTGFVATRMLFELLNKTGHNDLSFAMMRRTEYPSFGFMLEQGTTTIWERWQYLDGNEMNSHNHSPFGGVDEFFYRVPGGVQQDFFDEDGRARITIAPYFDENLQHVNCEKSTAAGKVAVVWNRTAEGIRLELTVPKNAAVDLVLRDGYACQGETQIRLTGGEHDYFIKK